MADRDATWAQQWLSRRGLGDRAELLSSIISLETLLRGDIPVADLADVLRITREEARTLISDIKMRSVAPSRHPTFTITRIIPQQELVVWISDCDAERDESLRVRSLSSSRVRDNVDVSGVIVSACVGKDRTLLSGEVAVTAEVAYHIGYCKKGTATSAIGKEISLARAPNIVRWGMIREDMLRVDDGSGIIALVSKESEVDCSWRNGTGVARFVSFTGRSIVAKVMQRVGVDAGRVLLSPRLVRALGLHCTSSCLWCLAQGSGDDKTLCPPGPQLLGFYPSERSCRADRLSRSDPVTRICLRAVNGATAATLNTRPQLVSLLEHVAVSVGDLIALDATAPGARAVVHAIETKSNNRRVSPGEVVYLQHVKQSPGDTGGSEGIIQIDVDNSSPLVLETTTIELPFRSGSKMLLPISLQASTPSRAVHILRLRCTSSKRSCVTVSATNAVLTVDSDRHVTCPLPLSGGAQSSSTAPLLLTFDDHRTEHYVCVSLLRSDHTTMRIEVSVEMSSKVQAFQEPPAGLAGGLTSRIATSIGVQHQATTISAQFRATPHGRPSGRRTCYLVVGPPNSGKAFVANALATELCFPMHSTAAAHHDSIKSNWSHIADPRGSIPHQAVVATLPSLRLPSSANASHSEVIECARHNAVVLNGPLNAQAHWGWSDIILIVVAAHGNEFEATLAAVERAAPSTHRSRATLYVQNKVPSLLSATTVTTAQRNVIQVPLWKKEGLFGTLSKPLRQAATLCLPVSKLAVHLTRTEPRVVASPPQYRDVEVEVEPPCEIVLYTDAVQVGGGRILPLQLGEIENGLEPKLSNANALAGIGPSTLTDLLTSNISNDHRRASNPIAEIDCIQRMLLHRPPAGYGAMSVREARVNLTLRTVPAPENANATHGPVYRFIQ